MPGSPTTPDRSGARISAPDRVAFRRLNSVGTRDKVSFAAQWLAYTLPYRRFADILTNACARLGADAGSLHLHRDGLAPSTPCRSPGALKLLLPPRQSRGVSLGRLGVHRFDSLRPVPCASVV